MLDRINLEALERSRKATLPDGNTLLLRSIVYADFAAHYITFHLKSGETRVSRITFSEIEPVLCSYSYFFSPSKGIIVNLHEIIKQSPGTVQMTDGTVLPVSRRKSKNMTSAYTAFCFLQLRQEGEN